MVLSCQVMPATRKLHHHVDVGKPALLLLLLLPATSGHGYSCQVSCTDAARRLARRRGSDQRRWGGGSIDFMSGSPLRCVRQSNRFRFTHHRTRYRIWVAHLHCHWVRSRRPGPGRRACVRMPACCGRHRHGSATGARSGCHRDVISRCRNWKRASVVWPWFLSKLIELTSRNASVLCLWRLFPSVITHRLQHDVK